MSTPRSTGIRRRGLPAIIATAAIVAVAVCAVPASAEAPPAAAGTTSHGFLVDDGVLGTIDHPDAPTIPALPDGQAGTVTSGINDRGEILGVYGDTDLFARRFVRDRKGRFTPIADPASGSAYEVVDINNRGEIVGFYNDEQFTTAGFLRSKNGRFTTIEFPDSDVTAAFKINDRRQIVGWYLDDGMMHGFLWDDGDYKTIDVPGAAGTSVLGINNRGQIVGSYVDEEGAHGFLRDRRGAVTTLPEAPGADPTLGGTVPSAINDHGQIVGGALNARGGSRAFLFERGVYTMFDGTGDAVYTRALDINNRGQIVGDYATKPATGSTPRVDPAERRRAGRAGLRPPSLPDALPLGLANGKETR
jgi:probable HAF family extracellular repeat protein